MVDSGLNQVESMGSQRQDHFLNLEQRKDREGSMHTTHTSKSQSRGGSLVSLEKGPCSERLIICEEDYAVTYGEGLFPILIPFLAKAWEMTL